MSTTHMETATEDEMYAIEFHDCELHEEPEIEEPEASLTCPVCAGEDLDFAMYYADPDPETGYAESCEMYHCRACGSVGDAAECAGPFPEPVLDWRQAGTLPPRVDAVSEARPAVALTEVA